jgi:class 3 adenylate cyclase
VLRYNGVVQPETRYARSGGVSIAYQVFGDGPLDLVVVPGWLSHLELNWEDPALSRFLRGLASFSRVLICDRRGIGLSDRVAERALPTLEQRMDDVRAVMDAAASERAALLGWSEGGPMCMLFAATYPHRTTALVVIGSGAALLRSEDNPAGVPRERLASLRSLGVSAWGHGRTLDLLAPAGSREAGLRRWWGRYERLSASPGAAVAVLQMAIQTDVREALPAIHVPTLILHRVDDVLVPVGLARELHARIAGSRLVELAGGEHPPWLGDQQPLLGEIEQFLTGARERQPDRVLATVVFVDIVDSTSRAAELGDRAWRVMLDRFRDLFRRELARFRGAEVVTTGDGFLATFDGPARAVRCALAATAAVRALGLTLRAGVHTGEIELIGQDVGGIAVHIAARVAAAAKPSEVLTSSTVRDLVAGSGLNFSDRGPKALKGVPGDWHLYAVEDETYPAP